MKLVKADQKTIQRVTVAVTLFAALINAFVATPLGLLLTAVCYFGSCYNYYRMRKDE